MPLSSYFVRIFPRVLPLLCAVWGGAACVRPAQAQVFGPPQTVVTQTNYNGAPISIGVSGDVLADFNGDGILDLLTISTGTAYAVGGQYPVGSLAVRLGRGNGVFQAASNIPAGTFGSGPPIALTVADLDGDGKLDLITPLGQTVHQSGGSNLGRITPGSSLSIAFGNGDGTFSAPVIFQTAMTPLATVVADFNSDGIPDLAVLSQSSLLTVYFGVGGGLFQGGLPYYLPANAGLLRIADLNGDHAPDILFSSGSGQHLSILYNNGDGTFAIPVSLPLSGTVIDAQAGDLNGDGRLDIAVLESGTNRIFVQPLLNQGQGVFTAGTSQTAAASGPMLLADVDGNGTLDAVIAASVNGDTTLITLLSLASAAPALAAPRVYGSAGLTLGDVYGFGRPDAAANNALYPNIFPNVTLRGTVTREGVSPNAAAIPAQFAFRDSAGTPLFIRSASIGPNGGFTLPPIPGGDYIVHVTANTHLAANVSLHALSGSALNLTVTLRAGDASGDNGVDLRDFNALVNAFGSSVATAGSGYNPNADFNGDGMADLTDFGLLVTNFGAQGDP